jgi:hypothetical protein
LQDFIDINGDLKSKVKGVIQASNLALVNIEWSFSRTGSDGKQVNIAVKAQIFYVSSQVALGVYS